MNIYIGNLHYGVSESDLTQIMEEYGSVYSTKLIMDRNTGRSKGFCICRNGKMPNEAGSAIKALNGTELEGRTMVVKESTPRQGY